MSELEKQAEATSKTVRNLLYLGSLVVAGFIGGAVAGPLATSVLKAPADLIDVQGQIDALEERLLTLEGTTVRFDEKLVVASEYRDFVLQSRLDGEAAVAASDKPQWDDADEWFLRKSN